MVEYINNLNSMSLNKVVREMKKYASINKIPIVSDEGLIFILQLIRLTKATKILEIGTAIGYCAINIALQDQNINITTIEKNSNMYNEALKNVDLAGVNNQITIINKDGLEVNNDELFKEYDLIFIDAAKAQYGKFFEKYEVLLKKNGIIVCDNLLFHNMVVNISSIESKDLKALVRKIDVFNNWLSKNKKYRTSFYTIGDGMSVSEKI